MTLDDKTSNLVDGLHNTRLRMPTKMTWRHEPKNQLKLFNERCGTKKFKHLQRKGITQILTLHNNDLEIRGEQKHHCSFCNDDHGVNVCTVLKIIREKRTTYQLTSVNMNIRTSLKDRLRMPMSVVVDVGRVLLSRLWIGNWKIQILSSTKPVWSRENLRITLRD